MMYEYQDLKYQGKTITGVLVGMLVGGLVGAVGSVSRRCIRSFASWQKGSRSIPFTLAAYQLKLPQVAETNTPRVMDVARGVFVVLCDQAKCIFAIIVAQSAQSEANFS